MMKLFFVLLTSISLFTYASEPAHNAPGSGQDTSHELKSKAGANLNLFPEKQQDASKKAVPAKPTLTEPAYKAAITGGAVTLRWNAVDGANAYHVQVATDPAFKWLVSDEWNLTATSFEQKNLQAGQSYFWRVAALRTANESGFMKGWFAHNMFVAK